jgi:hypothetical protein
MWSYGSTNYYAFAREHKELLYKITKAYSDYMKAKQTYFFFARKHTSDHHTKKGVVT